MTISIIEAEFDLDLELNVMLVPCDFSLHKCHSDALMMELLPQKI